MPPLEMRPGSHYSTEADTDHKALMGKALAGEFEVIEVRDETGLNTHLFSPSGSGDDSDLIVCAMMEGVLRGVAFGNRIISRGQDLRDQTEQ